MALIYCIEEVQESIFQHIHDEDEDNKMDEDTYLKKVSDISHEQIHYTVSNEHIKDVENYIHEYGIHKAICEHIAEFGAIEDIDNGSNFCRSLLYSIIRNKITYTFKEYKLWLKKWNYDPFECSDDDYEDKDPFESSDDESSDEQKE
jgi:hypothetical protein